MAGQERPARAASPLALCRRPLVLRSCASELPKNAPCGTRFQPERVRARLLRRTLAPAVGYNAAVRACSLPQDRDSSRFPLSLSDDRLYTRVSSRVCRHARESESCVSSSLERRSGQRKGSGQVVSGAVHVADYYLI